jgi:hypothetical protein
LGVLLGIGDGTFTFVQTYASGAVQTMYSAGGCKREGRPDVVTGLCAVDQPCGFLVNGAVGVLPNNQPLCNNRQLGPRRARIYSSRTMFGL